jgi:hypothetical protein
MTKDITKIIVAIMMLVQIPVYLNYVLTRTETVTITNPNPLVHEVEAKEEVGSGEEIESQDSLGSIAPSPTNSVEAYIYEVFGKDAERGIKMLKECENKSMNPYAINWNNNGTWDFGTWQINQVHGYTQEELADPYFNTDVAYKIYKGRGNTFSAWTCSYVIGDKSFWQ